MSARRTALAGSHTREPGPRPSVGPDPLARAIGPDASLGLRSFTIQLERPMAGTRGRDEGLTDERRAVGAHTSTSACRCPSRRTTCPISTSARPLPRLSSLTTKVELEGLRGRADRPFRSAAREVNTLLLVVRIKAMCKRAGIAKLDGGPKGATIQFHNDKFASPEGAGGVHPGAARTREGQGQQDRRAPRTGPRRPTRSAAPSPSPGISREGEWAAGQAREAPRGRGPAEPGAPLASGISGSATMAP